MRFEDNECHSDGLYGINLGEGVERVGPDERHPLVVRNMKIWATHYAVRAQSPCLLLDNVRIYRCNYGIYHPDYDRHVYRNLSICDTPSEPFNSGFADNSIQYGTLAVDGLELEGTTGNGIPIKLTHYNRSGVAVSHFRNVKLVDLVAKKGLVNMVGGKWLLPTTPKGVPTFIHDYFGPGRHAKIVSRRAEDLMGDGNAYREVPGLTGEESRAAEVKDVEFPKILDPIDDRPPQTVITHVMLQPGGKRHIRGTTSDDGVVRRVVVNGQEAEATAANFSQWQVTLDGRTGSEPALAAHAEDAAGNVEPRPHLRSAAD